MLILILMSQTSVKHRLDPCTVSFIFCSLSICKVSVCIHIVRSPSPKNSRNSSYHNNMYISKSAGFHKNVVINQDHYINIVVPSVINPTFETKGTQGA